MITARANNALTDEMRSLKTPLTVMAEALPGCTSMVE